MSGKRYQLQCWSRKLVYTSGTAGIDAVREVTAEGRLSNDREWFSWLAGALREILIDHPKGESLRVILPSFPVLSQTFRIPRVKAREIRGIIEAYVRQKLPCDLDQSIYTYQILGSNELEYRILLSIVSKRWMESFQEILKATGVDIASVESPAWLIGQGQEKAGTIMFVQFDQRATFASIFGEEGFYTRNLFLSIETGTVEIFYKQLREELGHTVSYYRNLCEDNNLDKIEISGQGVELEEIAKELQESMGVAVSIADGMGVLRGAMNNDCSASFVKTQKPRLHKLGKFRGWAAACAAILVMVFGGTGYAISELNAEYGVKIAKKSVQLEHLLEKRSRIEALKREKERYKNIVEKYGSCIVETHKWNGLLAEVQKCLDEAGGIWLDGLEINEKRAGQIILKGRSIRDDGMASVKQFLVSMERLSTVKEVSDIEVSRQGSITCFKASVACNFGMNNE